MIEQLPYIDPPEWLMNLTAKSIKNGLLPLRKILHDSLYYPGAGTDGQPIRWLAGNVYSFVYTDYGVSRYQFLDALVSEETGFRGYRLLAQRDITMKELIPSGWTPMLPEPADGNPNKWRESCAEPFCIWTILERLPDYTTEHGPDRFSLLYLCSDGAAGYQALYNSNLIKPKVFFLINHGFGDNWTNFEDPSLIMARSVRSNPVSMPDYLVGRYAEGDKSYWPNDYSGPALCHLHGGHDFGIWKR